MLFRGPVLSAGFGCSDEASMPCRIPDADTVAFNPKGPPKLAEIPQRVGGFPAGFLRINRGVLEVAPSSAIICCMLLGFRNPTNARARAYASGNSFAWRIDVASLDTFDVAAEIVRRVDLASLDGPDR
jgi:hypothetical protein